MTDLSIYYVSLSCIYSFMYSFIYLIKCIILTAFSKRISMLTKSENADMLCYICCAICCHQSGAQFHRLKVFL